MLVIPRSTKGVPIHGSKHDKLIVGRDYRFLSLDKGQSAEPEQGSTLYYPFKLLEQKIADVSFIPATVHESEYESNESEEESDEPDLEGFETSCDDAIEETIVEEEEALEELGISDSQKKQNAADDNDVSPARKGLSARNLLDQKNSL